MTNESTDPEVDTGKKRKRRKRNRKSDSNGPKHGDTTTETDTGRDVKVVDAADSGPDETTRSLNRIEKVTDEQQSIADVDGSNDAKPGVKQEVEADTEESEQPSKRKRKRKRKKKSSSAEDGDDGALKSESLEEEKKIVETVEHTVYVEGIPFDSSEQDVKDFFISQGCKDVCDMRLPK